MHPEVRLDAPGKCPKCGMELIMVPMDHTAHHAQMGHNFKTLFFQPCPLQW